MSELELSTSDSDTSLQRRYWVTNWVCLYFTFYSLHFSRQFDIINEEDEEDIEEFEMHEDSSDISNRDLTYNINFGEQVNC